MRKNVKLLKGRDDGRKITLNKGKVETWQGKYKERNTRI